MSHRLGSLIVLMVVASLAFSLVTSVPATRAQQATGFTVVSAVWGTASAPVQAAPGSQNVPLVITLQYYFTNTAQGISVTVDLPPGFTDTNGNSVTTAYVSGQVPTGAVVPLTFNLNIASDTPLGTYLFPMSITWGAIVVPNPIQSVSETQAASVTIPLRGKVLLQFSAGAPTLSPGTVNRVPLLVTNGGTGNATNVDLAVSPTSSLLSSSTVSVLNTPPEISVIPPNSTVTTNLSIFAAQSLAGTSLSLTISGSYSDAYGNTRAIASSVGLYVASAVSQPVAITAGPTQLTPGSVNNVTISISNTGQRSLSLLQVNVALPPSVSLLKQFPVTVSDLAAGASAQVGMPIFVSSSLSGSPITITATVTYTDAAGNTGTATQSLGFYVPISQNPNIRLSGFSYNPPLIFPGTTVAALQVAIYNSGTSPGSDVNATLFPADPVYSIAKGSLSQVAGLLPVGQGYSFTFTLGIMNSTEPINSTLVLVISSSGAGSARYNIPFVEQPKAHFNVVSVASPQVASGDGADQLTITLSNVGKAAAQVTTFTMQPSYVFEPSTQGSFTTSPNAGIGTVSAGDGANLTVVIQVNSNLQPGSYPLVFHATWSQLGSSQPFGQDIVVMVPVRSSVFQAANSTILSVPVLALVLILAGALVFRRSRRRSRKKAAKEAAS